MKIVVPNIKNNLLFVKIYVRVNDIFVWLGTSIQVTIDAINPIT